MLDRTTMTLLRTGKVRDIYSYDENHLLFRTSDRLSAFDVVLPDTIPGKGAILNKLTRFWMERFKFLVPNHLTSIAPPDPLPFEQPNQLEIVKKLTPITVEAIVRGYLVGSGWKEYQQQGTVCGIKLDKKLQMAEKLPVPVFTPSTKADVGDHDVNISYEQAAAIVGHTEMEYISRISLLLYNDAAEYAIGRGIIIADTKFEFGIDSDGNIRLMDEVLTPDSSRFWSVSEYQVGSSPPSYDKQIVRDYLETLDWDKTSPGPMLPQSIINKTVEKYREVAELLCS